MHCFNNIMTTITKRNTCVALILILDESQVSTFVTNSPVIQNILYINPMKLFDILAKFIKHNT